jgi:hypothetical protein
LRAGPHACETSIAVTVRASRFALYVVVATSGCKLFDDPLATADIPDDFPQLDELQSGKAELVVDGEMLTTKDDGGTFYDPGGLEPDPLPTSASFDYALHLDWLSPEEGTYETSKGELTASWSGFEANAQCGTGTLVIVGSSHAEGLVDSDVIWGTLQLELCEFESGEPTSKRMEISGRFSSELTEL